MRLALAESPILVNELYTLLRAERAANSVRFWVGAIRSYEGDTVSRAVNTDARLMATTENS